MVCEVGYLEFGADMICMNCSFWRIERVQSGVAVECVLSAIGSTAEVYPCLRPCCLLKTCRKIPNVIRPWLSVALMSGNRPLNSALNAITSPRPCCHLWCQAFCKFGANYSVRTRRRLSVNSEGEGDVAKTGDWQAGTREKQDEEEAQKEKG